MKTKKENLILIIGMMIILGTHLLGCDKLPGGDPVEPEVRPKVELSVTPEGVIPYGGSLDIRWTADQNTNKVVAKVNGEVKATSSGSASRAGALYLSPMFKDALISVVATNVDLSTEAEKEVHVGDWTTSTFGLVSYYPWNVDSLGRSSLDGKVLKRWEVASELLSVTSNFHRDGRYINSDYPTVVLQWSVPDSNTIVINGSTRKLQVNQEQMIISYQTSYNGQPVWFDQIYRHASDTPTDPE